MAQAENVVHGRFRLDADDAGLVMAAIREARIRSGMTRAEFAGAINRANGRRVALGAGSVEAYEMGGALPVADVLLVALSLGGLDVRHVLRRWLYG